MKKILPIAVVVVILLLIGKIIMSGEASELEEDIVSQVEQGNYYAALQDANEIELKGEKISKKISKLIEDVKLHEAAEKEMEKYSQMNLGKIKAILDEMNGSYKKYDLFITKISGSSKLMLKI